VLLRAEYHLSQLLALHLIKLLGHTTIQHREAACRQLLGLRSSIRHISHDISSHRGTTELSTASAGHHLLLHEHAVSPIHLLLWVHASTVGLLLHLLVVGILLLALVLQHVVLLLELIWPLSVLRGGLGLSLLVGALRLPLPVLDLVRLRPLIIALVILVIDH